MTTADTTTETDRLTLTLLDAARRWLDLPERVREHVIGRRATSAHWI